jgi:tetratricopeptide (TPR) repeat protein
MSGLELQEALNERGAVIPVIFITGHGDIPMAVEAMRHGAFDFLQKPFRDQDLIDRIQQALARDAGAWQTWMNLGVTRYGQRRYADALEAYARAQALAPGEPDLLLNEGNALLELGRHEEARARYEQVRALRPQDAQVHMNLGNAWRQAQQHAQAWPHYEQALQLAPDDADVHFNFGLSLLAGGDYARGWRENEWRWRARGLRQSEPPFATPKWLGEQPLAGRRLLLHAEQGLGDTLMLCRYAVAAAERGARVLLQVQKPLVALLREALPQVEQVLGEDEPLPPHDLHCPLMSLPLAFGTTLETIPQPPYLQVPPERVQHWRERLPGAPLHIGLAWAGNPKFAGDAGRSLDLATLLPALPQGPRYWCLQKDVPERDAAAFSASGIARFEENGFADTAAQLLAMDLLVSTDTSIPHLAGALGCPTLLLLGFSSDFRWLAERSDSPWYPSVRLLRQPRPGDWGPPLDELRQRIVGWR